MNRFYLFTDPDGVHIMDRVSGTSNAGEPDPVATFYDDDLAEKTVMRLNFWHEEVRFNFYTRRRSDYA